MDTPTKYKSVIPSEMTERELNSMCRDIQTAIDRKLPFTRVRLQNDMRCRVETSRLKDYQGALKSVEHESLSDNGIHINSFYYNSSNIPYIGYIR